MPCAVYSSVTCEGQVCLWRVTVHLVLAQKTCFPPEGRQHTLGGAHNTLSDYYWKINKNVLELLGLEVSLRVKPLPSIFYPWHQKENLIISRCKEIQMQKWNLPCKMKSEYLVSLVSACTTGMHCPGSPQTLSKFIFSSYYEGSQNSPNNLRPAPELFLSKSGESYLKGKAGDTGSLGHASQTSCETVGTLRQQKPGPITVPG